MAIPIVKYSNMFLNGISWFMKVGGITLWPWIILRENYRDLSHYSELNERIIRHETIHIKQQQEMLVLPFYIWYMAEFFIKFLKYGKKSYVNLSFEREAKQNENDLEYLKNRKFWAWFKYL